MHHCVYCGEETELTVKIAEPQYRQVKKDKRVTGFRAKELVTPEQRIFVCRSHADQVSRSIRRGQRTKVVRQSPVMAGQTTIDDYL